jgi:hypothetical protein
MSKPVPAIDPKNDGIHLAGDDPWWREGWYFEFFDAGAALQFQAYQGVFPNAALGDINAAVFHRGKRVHVTSKMDFHVAAEPVEQRLCFGPMKLEEINPLEQWRIRYDAGEISADLLFDAVHPPFSWAISKAPTKPGEKQQPGSHHFDQLGRYRGSFWIGNEEIQIDALGFRDRMWGWGGRKHWQSYLIMWAAFDEDCIANIAVQRFDDGRQTLSGYLHQEKQQSLLKNAVIDITWDEKRWKTIECVNVLVNDELGRSFKFSGKPQGILDTSHRWLHRNDHMLFSVGEYQHGDRTGHGVLNWAFTGEADLSRHLEASND